ncbi:hypothetical protein C4K22_4107 [Pseudomonas chlororaphis subsp. aurantiaca]|nr:hypothetical protein C4K22_4107 [Pseudomonas chlororaphis subsp. aurantiaca]AZD80551.1 hypothetical protein C4K15_3988 [Pseudomonas chlororaphis subsp. aurantiaca]
MMKAASLPASGALSRASRIAARSLLQTHASVGARLARDGVGTDDPIRSRKRRPARQQP